MKNKYLVTVVLSLLFSLVFLGASESEAELREAAAIFNTSWLDALKGIVVGVVLGFVLRTQSIRTTLKAWPMGSVLYGSNLLFLGIGAILIGLFGASILYIQHGEIEFARVPLHSAVMGLSMISIYYAIRWNARDAI